MGIPKRALPSLRILAIFLLSLCIVRHSISSFVLGTYLLVAIIGFILFIFRCIEADKFKSIFCLIFLSTGFIFHIILIDVVKTEDENLGPQFVGMAEVLTNPKINHRIKVELQLRHQAKGTAYVPRKNKILAYFSNSEAAEGLEIGDWIYFKGSCLDIRKNANPKAFDYKNHLANMGIYQQVYINKGAWTKIDHQHHSIKLWFSNYRERLVQILSSYIKGKDERAVAMALILGQRNQLSTEIKNDFSNSGAMHVLAVSGLHLGILCKLFYILFSLLPLKARLWKTVKNVLIIIGIWGFALLTGASPSVLRAALMLSLFILGYHFFRSTNSYNILSTAALILLIYDPYLIHQIGFQFSFLAVLGILIYYPLLENLLPSNSHPILKNSLALIFISVAAQLMLAPLSIYYFNKFPSYFIPSSLIAIPAATLILSLGISLIFSHYFHVSIAYYLGLGLDQILFYFLKSITWINQLPYSNIYPIYLSEKQCILAYFFLFSLSLVWIHKSKRGILLLLISITAFSLSKLEFEYHQITNDELIVYQTQKGIAIDVFTKFRCYKIRSEDIKDKTLDWERSNYAISKMLWEEKEVRAEGLLKAGKLKVLFADNKTQQIPKELDLIILGNYDYSQLSEALSLMENVQIILLPKCNISEVLIQQMSFCNPLHQVDTQGYFKMTI